MMQLMNRNLLFAHVVIVLLAALLAWWGYAAMHMPAATLAHEPHDHDTLPYQGEILIAIAAFIFCFQRWLSQKLVWVFQGIYRLASLLMLVTVGGLEGLMHILSIPHMEGWWIPLLGSSALMGGMVAWFKSFKSRRRD